MTLFRRFRIFVLLTLLSICITSCGDMKFSITVSRNLRNHLTTLTSLSQENYFTDSPYLTAYPGQLNKNNCQTSNNQTWTCIVTLTAGNLNDMVVWNVSTSTPNITFSHNMGYLVPLAPSLRITISNIRCTNTSFLFSGQIYGGGGVFPTTVTWSCVPQPTPSPAPRPTSRPTAQPRPTSKIVPTPTPAINLNPTPSINIQQTVVVPSDSYNDPTINGNGDLAGNIFMISALIFTMFVALFELVIIILMSRRMSFKRP